MRNWRVRLGVGAAALALLIGGAAKADPPSGLHINEVAVGAGGGEFIEIYNASESPQSLAEVTISTGVANFPLGTATIAPGDFFLLYHDVAAGPGDKRMNVTTGLTTYLSDTVLLKSGATILDAMSFGTTLDASPRYAEAVAAGQFPGGQFVNISDVVDSIVIGRDAAGADTNSLPADWKVGYALASFGATPGSANTGGELAEKMVTWCMLKRVYETLFTGFGPSVTMSSHTDYTVVGNTASANYSLTTRPEAGACAPFNAAQTMTGTLSTTYTRHGDDGCTFEYWGTLANGSLSLMIATKEDVEQKGHLRKLGISATLSFGGSSYDYAEQTVQAVSGGPAGRNYTLIRSSADMTGQARVSSSEYGVTPTIVGGVAISATSHVHRTCFCPPAIPSVWDWWKWIFDGCLGPKPAAVTTTLVEDYDVTISNVANGISVAMANHTLKWGDGKETTWTNEGGAVTADQATGALSGTYSFSYVKNGETHVIEKSMSGQVAPNGDLAFTVNVTNDSEPLGSYQGHVDGFWGELWNAAATIVTGAVCGAGTIVVGAASGVATATSLGTLSLPAVAATGVTMGGCAYMTNKVYDATKP
jgi:hypothetical protein